VVVVLHQPSTEEITRVEALWRWRLVVLSFGTPAYEIEATTAISNRETRTFIVEVDASWIEFG